MAGDDTRATTRLYLITPPALDPERFAKELEEALAGGDVACLQLRLKDIDDDAIRRAARVLKPIAQDRDVAFIMNDRPDLAAELDCDGVHVGEEDMPYFEARRLLGPDRIVGVTCGASRDRAITAAEAGADYVAFGAFFPSTTKAAKHHADPELLRDWSETTVVPCCAIGGITQEICGPLVEAGADFLAVIGAIWSHPRGPRAAVTEFNEVFARYGRAYRTSLRLTHGRPGNEQEAISRRSAGSGGGKRAFGSSRPAGDGRIGQRGRVADPPHRRRSG